MAVDVEQLAEKIQTLPRLSSAVMEVMGSMSGDDIDIAFLEQKISSDPPLVARLLSVANSPFYGVSGKIASVGQACMVLGVYTTCNIVMSVGVMDALSKTDATNMDIDALWKHSIGVGVAAKVLAGMVRMDEGQAFTAGLLHDMGRIVLDIYFADEYAQALAYQAANACSLEEAERMTLGIDHAMVGEYAARYWQLPEGLRTAIAYHHEAASDKASDLACLVNVADLCNLRLADGGKGHRSIADIRPEVLERLGLKLEDVEGALPQIQALSESSAMTEL